MLPTDSGVDLIISGNIKICTDVYKCINGADDGNISLNYQIVTLRT